MEDGVKEMEALLLGQGVKHATQIPNLLYKGYEVYEARRRNRKAHQLASQAFGFVREPDHSHRSIYQRYAAKRAAKTEVYQVHEGPTGDSHVALEFKSIPLVRRKYHFGKKMNKIYVK